MAEKKCDRDDTACHIDNAVSASERRRNRQEGAQQAAQKSAPKKQDRGNIVTGGIKAINKAKQRRSKY